MLNKKTLLMAALFLITGTSFVYADERYPPIKDETVTKECGDCHMAFQPQMLPQRSWIKIMDTLGDHFGEDASLDKATIETIKNYLTENAADAGWLSGKFMRGVRDNWTPLRITEIPYWVREHNEEVPNYAWSDPKVRSKANCAACHPRAKMGNYDDD
jgi:hypothetical protein